MKKLFHFRFAFLLILSIFLSSCTHLIKLDYAQRNFNQAATIDNNAQFSTNGATVSAESYYRLAYAHVNDAVKGGNKKRLDEDGVLGNAYTIKALCEWKLGDYKKASATAELALLTLVDNNNSGGLLNRDAAVMKAMDPLIAMEESSLKVPVVLNATSTPGFDTTKTFYETWIDSGNDTKPGKVKEAINQIDGILNEVSSKHEVRAYFIVSQLSALKTWKDALNYINVNGKKYLRKALNESDETVKAKLNMEGTQLKGYYKDQNKVLEPLVETYLQRFADLDSVDENNKILQYWKLTFNE